MIVPFVVPEAMTRLRLEPNSRFFKRRYGLKNCQFLALY